MSKNIVIQEGGVGRQFSADRLKTATVGGGHCYWVPEDEVQLRTLFVTENGTYKAEDEECYGYSEVTVNGIGAAVGLDSDGDTACATVDPETGLITIKKLPSRIQITTPPSILSYSDGDAINYSGMVVKAYLESGELWTDENHPNGVIPLSELTLPENYADYAAATHTGKVSTDFNITPNPFDIGSIDHVSAWSVGGGAYRRDEVRYSDNVIGSLKRLDSHVIDHYIASSEPFSETWESKAYEVSKQEAAGLTNEQIAKSSLGTLYQENSGTVENSSSYTYNGKTVYYYAGTGYYGAPTYWDIEPITVGNADQIAWAMVYGDIIESGTENIPVQYIVPESGNILSDEFTIHVEGITETNGGAGQSGTGSEAGSSGEGSDSVSPVPEGITVQDLNIAVYNAMNAGQDHIEIDGTQYTLAEAQAMIDYLAGNGGGE